MSGFDPEIDDYYFDYVLTGVRGRRARLESVDELYEGFLLRDDVSETRIGSIGDSADGEFNALEESFFSAGDRLADDADADAREMAELIAELAS